VPVVRRVRREREPDVVLPLVPLRVPAREVESCELVLVVWADSALLSAISNAPLVTILVNMTTSSATA
jgi:hypothetical protein